MLVERYILCTRFIHHDDVNNNFWHLSEVMDISKVRKFIKKYEAYPESTLAMMEFDLIKIYLPHRLYNNLPTQLPLDNDELKTINHYRK